MIVFKKIILAKLLGHILELYLRIIKLNFLFEEKYINFMFISFSFSIPVIESPTITLILNPHETHKKRKATASIHVVILFQRQ